MRLPELVVAGGAGEVVRTLAPEEDRVSLVDHGLLLRLVELGRELHAAGLAGDIGGDRAKVLHRLSAGRVRPLDQLVVADALEFLHAPHQASLQVHHLAGVGEIARQFGERAIDHAGALAEIAFLERDLVRAGGVFQSPSPRSASSNPGLLHGSSLSIWRYFSMAFSVSSCARASGVAATSAQHAARMRRFLFTADSSAIVIILFRGRVVESQARQSSQPIHARIHALVGMGKRVTHDPWNTIARSSKSRCKARPIT